MCSGEGRNRMACHRLAAQLSPLSQWSTDLRTVLAIAFGDSAAVALRPFASRKQSHHPHWMGRGIVCDHYTSTGPRSSGDVRSEPQPRAKKLRDVGCKA